MMRIRRCLTGAFSAAAAFAVCCVVCCMIFIALSTVCASAADSVSYIDVDGKTKTAQCEMVNTLTDVDGVSMYNEAEGHESWYYVAGTGFLTFENRLNAYGDVHLILGNNVSLLVEKGIHVPSGSSLTIYAQSTGANRGRLYCSKKFLEEYPIDIEDCAAIGGNEDETNGDITINGGEVWVKASDNAAGIGGGNEGHGGNITINDGKVTAKGGYDGAGIGGGDEGGGGNVTVNGGQVIARGGISAAGIGGGDLGNGGHVVINEGDVFAESGVSASTVSAFFSSGMSGAGIGGGRCGHAGLIEIKGGNVNAYSRHRGAAIGNGGDNNSSSRAYSDSEPMRGGVIRISGGTVTADPSYERSNTMVERRDGGAGIGSGAKSFGVMVTITGGRVDAYGSFYDAERQTRSSIHFSGLKPSACIGTGYDAESRGQVTISGSDESKTYVFAHTAGAPNRGNVQTAIGAAPGSDDCSVGLEYNRARVYSNGKAVDAKDRLSAIRVRGEVEIKYCEEHQDVDFQKDAEGHWKNCPKCGTDTEKEEHTFKYVLDADHHHRRCTVCGYETEKVEHEFDQKSGKCVCGLQGVKVTIQHGAGKFIGNFNLDEEGNIVRWIKKGSEYTIMNSMFLVTPEMSGFKHWNVNYSTLKEYKSGDKIVVNSDTVVTPVIQASWSKFKKAVEEAENGAVVKLPADCSARSAEDFDDPDTHIVIAKGKDVTIDLNGYTLDRNFTDVENAEAKGTGDAIRVEGKLTLIDSSESGKGRIEGGNNAYAEDGIHASDEFLGGGALTVAGGELVMKSGTIASNSSAAGGAAAVSDGGTFTMEGGTLTYNMAWNKGSAVYVDNGKLIMKGGSVIDNFSFTTECPAVCLGENGLIEVEGSPVINGNKTVTADKRDMIQMNVSLGERQVIEVTGQLDEGASIGVTAEPQMITNRRDGYGAVSNFTSDNTELTVQEYKGQFYLVKEGEDPVETMYNITLESGKGGRASVTKDKASEGQMVNLLVDSADEGYRFKEWQLTGEGAEILHQFTGSAILRMGKGDVQVKAVFEPIPVTGLDISMKSSDGSVIPVSSGYKMTLYKYDSIMLIPSVVPSNALDKTVKWTVEGDSVSLYEEEGIIDAEKAGTSTVTVASASEPSAKASIEITVIEKAEVSIDSDNDETRPTIVFVDDIGLIEKPDNPVKDGYRFVGWRTVVGKDEGGKDVLDDKDFDFNEPVDENIVIKAIWEHVQHDSETLKKVEAVEETCTEDGTAEHWHCDICGKDFADENGAQEITAADMAIPAAHKWGAWEPDNDNDEQHVRKCERCTATEAESHKWDKGEVTKEPTATEKGELVYTCSGCGHTVTVPVKELQPDEFSITAKRVGAGTAYASPVAGKTGDTVKLYAEPASGYKFAGWEISGRGAEAEDTESKLTELKVGTARVIATAVFEPVTAEKITISVLEGETLTPVKDKLSMKEGQTLKFAASIDPEDAVNGDVKWSVADDSVASVTADGVLTAKAVGTTTLKVELETDPEISASVKVIVKTSHEHSGVNVEEVASDCQNTGVKEHYECSGCGKLFLDEECKEEVAASDLTIPVNGDRHTSIKRKEKENDVPATCTRVGGYDVVVYCQDCGAVISREHIVRPKLGHKWGEWTVTKEATETEAGEEKRVCENDPAHVETRVIPVKGHVHQLTEIAAVDAKCEEDGNIRYYVCDHGENPCGRYFRDAEGKEEISKDEIITHATGHKYGSEVRENEVPASCTEPASYEAVVYCENCSKELSRDKRTEGSAAGHKWDDGKVEKEATCTEGGTVIYTCTACGAERTADISAAGHKLNKVEATEADCQHTGVIEHYECSSCGRLFLDDQAEEEVKAKDLVIPVSGDRHASIARDERVNDVPATCTRVGGYDVVVYCQDCGAVISREHIVRPKLGHKWGEWTVTKEAAETAPGEEQRVCENDPSHVETRVIPVADHVHHLIEMPAHEATCEEDGNIAFYVCGEGEAPCGRYFSDPDGKNEISSEDIEVHALGHSRGKAVRENELAANCTAPGYYEEVVYCKRCGKELSRDPKTEGSALGHRWDEGKVTKEPTYDEEGVLTYTCTVCGETMTEPIPKKEKNPEPEPEPEPEPIDRKEQKGEDGTSFGKGASLEAAEAAISGMKSDKDPAGTRILPLLLKSSKQTKSSIKLTWKTAKGATRYIVYANKCGSGSKLKKLASLSSSKKAYTVKKAAGKKLKKATYYKFMIIAVDAENNVVSSSKIVHVATAGSRKKANHKKVIVKAKLSRTGKTLKKYTATSAVRIKAGKTTVLKASLTKAKKTTVKKHVAVRYESSNPSVVSVTSKGKIKGLKKGTAKIYAAAQSGVYKVVKVTVK